MSNFNRTVVHNAKGYNKEPINRSLFSLPLLTSVMTIPY